MSDVKCRKCLEPWDTHYLRHEGLWESPGSSAPKELIEYHIALLIEDDRRYAESGNNPDYEGAKHNTDLLLEAVAKGKGCPACWDDPSRINNDPEQELEALRHNAFDSGYEGDPMELL